LNQLKPKAQHEQLLASADQALIVQYLEKGQDRDVAKIAVKLAYQCDLFVHFQRLWQMRVSGLDEKLSTDKYIKEIFVNRRTLYKELNRTTSSQ
jgi:hypothetical protein